MTIAEEMYDFQKTHAIKHLNVRDLNWNYINTGNGNITILMLHGGTGSSESTFKYIAALEKDYRVIAPTIPTSITTVREALNGIETILRIEGTIKMNCVGFSMGGMLEQVFLREHQEQIETLVLFHCPAPSKSYAKSIQRTLRINSIMPTWLFRILSKYLFKRALYKYPNVPKEEKDFWVKYYSDKISKERMTNQTRIVLDYLQNYHFTLNDLSNWHGKILIFETATDNVIPEGERRRIKEIYPNAYVHTFSEGDHLGNGIFMFDTTISLIKDFLSSIVSE